MNTPAQSFPPLYDLSHVPPGPVLVVAPHPDDEIIGCGGAIALHGRRGDTVHVALVTRGERGGAGEARLDESRSAAAALGPTLVTCLEAPDGDVAGDTDLPRRLAELVAATSPSVVYAPSPFEMHRDHVATLHATAAALEQVRKQGGPAPTLLLFEVNTESMASFLLDITPVAEAKGRALATFASQLGMIDIVSKADARARARTVNVDLPEITHAEAFLRIAPGDVGRAQALLAELAAVLGLSGATA